MSESSEHNGETAKLLREIKQSLRQSSLSSSGISVMAFAIALTAIAITTEAPRLLNVSLWLIGLAVAYNAGILIYFVVNYISRKRTGAGKR